ncbi:MAG: RnfABCDGE type electron transport complex subunit G [Acidaminococcales bacterium]|nr:RnfABCDGE type electron transport complex subunit G [Acidaminococcales bacterium]
MAAGNAQTGRARVFSNSGGSDSEGGRKILRLGLILFIVAAVTGVILGLVYEITLEPIRKTQERLRNEILSEALPEARSFSPIELAPDADPMIQGVQKALDDNRPVGYCFTVASKGYGGLFELIVGITETGKLRAIRILKHSETPGLGAKITLPAFSRQYENRETEKLILVKSVSGAPDQVQAISGATVTSAAVTNGVNAALDYWKNNLRGGN